MAKKQTQRKWLEQMARSADREALRRARARVAVARSNKSTARARARAACKRARARFYLWSSRQRDQLRARIEGLRIKLRQHIEARRARLRACGASERRKVRQQHDARISAARAELAELLQRAKRERLWSRKGSPVLTRAERTQESDSQVEAELSPDQLVVWRQVKGQIKPRERMSRHEAFAHWMHEHPGEVQRLLERDAHAELERLLQDEEKERASARELAYAIAPVHHLRHRVHRVTHSDAVPF